jgi:hypothetical protein
MATYLVLIYGDEAVWEAESPEEIKNARAKDMRPSALASEHAWWAADNCRGARRQ